MTVRSHVPTAMPGETVIERLVQLSELAAEAGSQSVTQDARALLERVREGRFFVACLGQFKRGKSTLINALLGDEVLPSGVAPVTSVVTVVRWGERGARVRIGDAPWRSAPLAELDEYVSESKNPENYKSVRGVEVLCRSPVLERGLCLVDTPGIGSIFAGNTAETQAFVPHVDAAIVVLGGDPPISGEELTLVKDVAHRVRDVLYVLNKADRLSESERVAALEFTLRVLHEAVELADPKVFEVSAYERLRGLGPTRDWTAFVERFDAMAHTAGAELVGRAATRGFVSLTKQLERQLREAKAALVRPMEESEQRLQLLRRCAREAEQAALDLKFLFDAEQQKLGRFFDERRARFAPEMMPEVTRQLDSRLAACPTRRGPGVRSYAFRQAQDVTEPIVREWMERERAVAEHEFAVTTERFVDHANAFLEKLRASGQLPLDAVPAKLSAETGLRARSRYYFTASMTTAPPPLWSWIADWFRSEQGARRTARDGGLELARRLLEVNATRAVGDFDERITESRRGVEGTLRRRLQEVVKTAEEASERAAEIRSRGAEAVSTEMGVLEWLLARLEALRLKDES